MALATTLQEAIALSDADIRIKLDAGEALSAVCGSEGNGAQAFPLNTQYRAFPGALEDVSPKIASERQSQYRAYPLLLKVTNTGVRNGSKSLVQIQGF
ncbi:hypothetical protein [Microcoleus sp. MON2_D5]|uniref:hypothetical protein n=1 Tax=Microcoleus sp. MON2_D5 TaxID=2818833 RepID=UPI002FCF5433